MDKEARDVSTCIATAARQLGYHAENVSDYVDDPDRTNCLVRRYARFADTPILDRFVYENPTPDWVVLVEETIIKAVNSFRGTPDGQGLLVINSARDPRYLLKFLPPHMLAKLGKLVVVDATGLAEQRGSSPWMFVRALAELAFHRVSTGGAVERLAIRRGIAAPRLGALGAAGGGVPPPGEGALPRRGEGGAVGPRRGGAVPGRLRPRAPRHPARPRPAAVERQDSRHRRLRARRPGLRLPPAPPRLRQRRVRGPGPARRHAAGRHPGLASPGGGPRPGDRQAARPGRHPDPLRRPPRRPPPPRPRRAGRPG